MSALPAPIPLMVRRYQCPFCPRRQASKARTVEHMGRCWQNPAARGCKTCKHFDRAYGEYGDGCNAGVSLEGRPQCERCGGFGDIPVGPDLGMTECPECAGDGAGVKPGPIVHCDLWEPRVVVDGC